MMTPNKEINQRIWIALDKYRDDIGFSRFHSVKILELIATMKNQETVDQVLSNKELIRALVNTDGFTPPLYIYDFLNELVKIIKPQTHLDPWLIPSSPCNFFDFGKSITYCINQTSFDIIQSVFPNPKTEFHLGESWEFLSSTKNSFDLITCFPPFGLRSQIKEIDGLSTSSDFSTSLLLKASMLLNENGKAIFIMSPSFLFQERGKELINQLGLFVDAVFSIPSGAFLPQTNIASNLVVISKQIKEKTFIAEISNDEKTNKTVIDNYKNRRYGKVIQLGSLINFSELKSFQGLISENEMKELVKRIGYPPIRLIDVAININLLKAADADEVEHLSNSIYLPKIGNGPAVTTPSEMKMKTPKNYFQIQLDEEKANSTFVANYFNSAIGIKLRKNLEVGAIIPSISKSQLQSCVLYLPELKTQTELIEIDSNINQFVLRLEDLKRNLWKYPKSYNSIAKELKNINQQEKLEHWIDNLPFPISSILWRYYATKENSKKIEHLFHFFEALSEFFSMIMLSALVQDSEFYKQECHKWIDTDERFKEWYLKATFGNWKELTAKLSKATREYLADKDKQELCKSFYGNPSEAFLSMLTNKGIINILTVVNGLRNKWKGHGGITSEEENKQRLIILEQHLTELRKIIADGFEDAKIISSAKSGELEGGVYTFIAKELVGAKSPFKEVEIKTLVGLDKKTLYLTHSNQTKPVKLLPFIKFVESSDAVYFYTSVESRNVRWVSYHFDKDPELNQPAETELFKAFDFLKKNTE